MASTLGLWPAKRVYWPYGPAKRVYWPYGPILLYYTVLQGYRPLYTCTTYYPGTTVMHTDLLRRVVI